MLRKRFSLKGSKIKSRIVFRLPDCKTERHIVWKPFHDPAALPVMERLADALRQRGNNVTTPKNGKACDGCFKVTFASVTITVILLVDRTQQSVEFTLLSWPSQSLAQRLHRSAASPDEFGEWDELCSVMSKLLEDGLGAEQLERTLHR